MNTGREGAAASSIHNSEIATEVSHMDIALDEANSLIVP